MTSERISLYDNMVVTERQDDDFPTLLIQLQFPPRRWWQRLTMRAYSPVWRRLRGAHLLWNCSCDQPYWIRMLMLLHSLFAVRPIVQWRITETDR